MKLRVEIGGTERELLLERNAHGWNYVLDGVAGAASVLEVQPGVVSVLLDDQSFTVNVTGETASVGNTTYSIGLSDPRDRAANAKAGSGSGPTELRAHMPGKVISVYAAVGERVQAGQALAVVEAMKMQNDVKAPKTGILQKVYVAPGHTVSAGQVLAVVE